MFRCPTKTTCLALGGNCVAKGSVELQNIYACATKGKITNFMIIQGHTLRSLTHENEEEGANVTSDISMVFQNCSEATKDLEQIIVM